MGNQEGGSKAVITAAEKILALAKKVSEHPLPPPGEVRFYIRTHSGLYMISDSFADLSVPPEIGGGPPLSSSAFCAISKTHVQKNRDTQRPRSLGPQ
jgi:hypothetical protein